MAVSRTTRRGGLYGALLVTGLVAAAPVGAQPSDTTAISTQPLFVKKDAYYAAGFIVATIAAAPLDKYFAVRLQRPWAQENRFLEKTADIFRHSHPGNRIDDVLLSGSISRGANGGMALRVSILPGAMALSRR